jgi:transcriptional regulator with XRE-family HTH domain
MTQDIPDAIRQDPDALRAYGAMDWIVGALLHLEAARRAKGWTPAELAARLGCSPSTIVRWERDNTGTISLQHYIEWLVACDVIPRPITLDAMDSVLEADAISSVIGAESDDACDAHL